MGFSKYFLEQSDKMWGRGKDMIKYVLKRGGKMGSAFQVMKKELRNKSHYISAQIPLSNDLQPLGAYDSSNEMKALGVNLDILKQRASYVISAYSHSLSNGPESFDPAVCRKYFSN